MNEPRFECNKLFAGISIINACEATYKEALDAHITGAVPNYGLKDNHPGYISNYGGYIHWMTKEDFEEITIPIKLKENHIPSSSPKILSYQYNENDNNKFQLEVNIKSFYFGPNEIVNENDNDVLF